MLKIKKLKMDIEDIETYRKANFKPLLTYNGKK